MNKCLALGLKDKLKANVSTILVFLILGVSCFELLPLKSCVGGLIPMLCTAADALGSPSLYTQQIQELHWHINSGN